MRTCVQSVELKEAETFEDAYYYLMSGFCVFVLDGCPRAMVMGIQGWTKRSTDEPESESNVRGAKECFVESVNDNKALLRKRMKSCAKSICASPPQPRWYWPFWMTVPRRNW